MANSLLSMTKIILIVHSMDMVNNQVDGGITIAIISTSTTILSFQEKAGVYLPRWQMV